jgi:hypothetical protein
MARWHNLCDNLKIHISECIVRFRALKDKHGIKAGPVRWPRGPAVRRSCATGSSHHFQLHTPDTPCGPRSSFASFLVAVISPQKGSAYPKIEQFITYFDATNVKVLPLEHGCKPARSL